MVYVGPHFEVAISGTQVISTSYYYALGRPVAMRQGEVLSYLHGDHLGSTSVVSDESGQEVGRASYDPFGEVYTATGTLATDRRFTGQRLDETGLYYYGARYYDPVTGRFVQPDILIPDLSLPQDLNRYTYVRNNPLFYVDNDGQNPVAVVAGAVVLVTKLVDWGWTAWDAIQAGWTMINICLPEEERLWAALGFALALGFESFEPDDLLPAGLPLDDVARRALLKKLREIWQEEGLEGVIQFLRKELGDEATDKLLRHLDELGVYADEIFEGLGDLTAEEARQIQRVVDEAGQPLWVVGGVAKGERHAGSDIDYYFEGGWGHHFDTSKLPGIDWHGILGKWVKERLGPGILFQPGKPPRFYP
jgi:RHS repeat-associated protein